MGLPGEIDGCLRSVRGTFDILLEKNGRPAESSRLANIIGTEMRQAGFSPTLHHATGGNKRTG